MNYIGTYPAEQISLAKVDRCISISLCVCWANALHACYTFIRRRVRDERIVIRIEA